MKSAFVLLILNRLANTLSLNSAQTFANTQRLENRYTLNEMTQSLGGVGEQNKHLHLHLLLSSSPARGFEHNKHFSSVLIVPAPHNGIQYLSHV